MEVGEVLDETRLVIVNQFRIHYTILSTLGCLKFYIERVKEKLAASNENLAKAKKKMYGKNPGGRHSLLFPRSYSVDSHWEGDSIPKS